MSIREIAVVVVLVMLGSTLGRVLAEVIFDNDPQVVVIRVDTKTTRDA